MSFRPIVNDGRMRWSYDPSSVTRGERPTATEHRESELAYLVGSLGQDGMAVIDNGSRSIELVSWTGGELRDVVFILGHRIAYETLFSTAGDSRSSPAAGRDVPQGR